MNVYLCDTTSKIVSTTANVVKNLIDSGKSCMVFSDDKITLSLELEIASRLGGGYFDVEVITFKRYLSDKNTTAKVISKESSVMLIRKIIADLKSELVCFGNSVNTPNMAVVLYELISQLESAKISPSDLKTLIDNDSNISPSLLGKIKDVYTVYNRYDEEIKKLNLYDSNEYLSLMPELCKNDKKLKDTAIVISGFQSVTRQRYDVFKALYENAESFHAVISYDESSETYTGETYNSLLSISKSAKIYNECGSLPVEAEFIKKNFYNPSVFSEDFKPLITDNVSLYQASDSQDEAEHIAKDILSEIKTGLRYKDISIAVGNLAESLPYLTKTFSDYKIPYFVEKTTQLSEHPICDFILSVLDFERKGLYSKDFVKVINSSLFYPDKQQSDKLKNLVFKNMINRKGFKVPFTFSCEENAIFEWYREKLIKYTDKLSSATTVYDYAQAIKDMLLECEIDKNLQSLSCRLNDIGELTLANLNDRVFEKTISVLDEMIAIMGTSKISALDFKNVFLSGATGTKISSIPILSDAVYIGECKSVKIISADILYAMGLGGDVPFTKSDTSILSDGDLSVLDGFNVIIEPKIKAVNKRERENVLITLCSFNKKLKLSYAVSDGKGSTIYKSDALKYLISAFALKAVSGLKKGYVDADSCYIEKEAQGFTNENTSLIEIAKLYQDYKNGDRQTADKVASFYKATEILGLDSLKQKADELLKEKSIERYVEKGDNLSIKGGEISASVLESYFSCPYKNYANNLLKLKETQDAEIRVNETGTLLHLIQEKYVKSLDKVCDKISSDKLVEEIFSEIIEDENYKKYLSSSKLQYTLSMLNRECKRVCFSVYNSIKNSSFIPKYFEKRFGKGQDVPAIKLSAKSGEISVKGVVDRVDEFDNYVRIIDYKSGKISSSEESFYTGNKLQLYLYMNAFTRDGKKPAGSYYYPVKDGYSEVEETYTMRGKTVDSSDVLVATDNQIEENRGSQIVSVSLAKDGKPYKASAVLSEEEMQKYLKYSIKVSENCIDEIRTGYCTPSPYENACDYCAYGGMCGFSGEEGGLFRKVNRVTKSTIIDAVDESEKLSDKAENEYGKEE